MASVNEYGVVTLTLVDCVVLDAIINADSLPVGWVDIYHAAEKDGRMTPELMPKDVLGPWTGPIIAELSAVGYVEQVGMSVFPMRDSAHRKVVLEAKTVSDGHEAFQRLADRARWFTPMGGETAKGELFRIASWGGLYSKYAHEICALPGWPWLLGMLEDYIRARRERLISGVGRGNGIPSWMGQGGEDFVLRRHSRVVDELCQACTAKYLELLGIPTNNPR